MTGGRAPQGYGLRRNDGGGAAYPRPRPSLSTENRKTLRTFANPLPRLHNGPVGEYRKIAMAALALVTLGLVIAAVALLARGDGNAPIQVLPPPLTETPATAETDSDALASESVPEPLLQVYVAGAVRSPDVYGLPAGARLKEALEAAGGPTDDADLTAVNLARRVRDEDYYYILRVGEAPPPAASPLTDSDSAGLDGAPPSGNLVNLNTASIGDLETLPGIGPAKAQAILDYREGNGGFQSVEEITSVSGIGPATFRKIKDLVTVGHK